MSGNGFSISELYKKAPGMGSETKGRQSTPKRNQFILDLSREDVCDFILEKQYAVSIDRVNVASIQMGYEPLYE